MQCAIHVTAVADTVGTVSDSRFIWPACLLMTATSFNSHSLRTMASVLSGSVLSIVIERDDAHSCTIQM
jgi:hypothetical protein